LSTSGTCAPAEQFCNPHAVYSGCTQDSASCIRLKAYTDIALSIHLFILYPATSIHRLQSCVHSSIRPFMQSFIHLFTDSVIMAGITTHALYSCVYFRFFKHRVSQSAICRDLEEGSRHLSFHDMCTVCVPDVYALLFIKASQRPCLPSTVKHVWLHDSTSFKS